MEKVQTPSNCGVLSYLEFRTMEKVQNPSNSVVSSVTYSVLYYLEFRTMEKVQNPSNSVWHSPQSEPFRIYSTNIVLYTQEPVGNRHPSRTKCRMTGYVRQQVILGELKDDGLISGPWLNPK
jgi:hypothetical protein